MAEVGRLRVALEADIPALEALIPRSARVLQASTYTPEQIAAALGPVFGVDRQLIRDGTYFVVEDAGEVLGCGGWSRRRALYGARSEDAPLDARFDPARVRAFFVAPERARQGIGRRLLEACEAAAKEAGFARVELTATLAGVPLYTRFGYAERSAGVIPLDGAPDLPMVRMDKILRRRRIATHRDPDADALTAAWLAERYLFPGEPAEIVFVARSAGHRAGEGFDCSVDVGNVYDTDLLAFDHKPPAFADRNAHCATELLWEFLKERGSPVEHLAELVDTVHQGDRNPPGAATDRLVSSRRDGLHARVAQARRENEEDGARYRSVRDWLDEYEAGRGTNLAELGNHGSTGRRRPENR